MRHHQLLDRAQFSRAAIHLIQTHGSRATTIAMRRAVHLQQCGEEVAADTWRKIGDFVRVIEAGDKPCAGTPEDGSGERSDRRGALADHLEPERGLALAG